MKTRYILLLVCSLFLLDAPMAQVAVGTAGLPPDPSAMLDVQSGDRGLLIPRVALLGVTDVATVPNPTVSLLIYNTALAGGVYPGYYYWNGSSWKRLVAGGGPGEAWTTGGNAGTDALQHFLGTTDNQALAFRVNNQAAGVIDPVRRSVFLGLGAGASNTGQYNVFLGEAAGAANGAGSSNTLLGRASGTGSVGLSNATAIGAFSRVNASNSLVLGSVAGVNGATETVRVGIGTNDPAERLEVVGKTKTSSLQVTDGAESGRVLQSDNSGNAVWVKSTQLDISESDPQVVSSTLHKVPRWSGSALTDGTLFDNGVRLGIGTTNPEALLDIKSTGNVLGLFVEQFGGGWGIQANSFQPGSLSIAALTAGGTAFKAEAAGVGTAILGSTELNAAGSFMGNVYVNSGSVGIGTTSPEATLHVKRTTPSLGSALFAESNSGWTIHANSYSSGSISVAALTDNGTALFAEGAGVGSVKLCSTDDQAAGLFTGDVYVLSGSLGIGTTSPAGRLEVSGNSGVTARLTTTSGSDVNLDFKRSGNDWRIRNSGGILYFGQSSDDLATVADVLRLGGGSVTPAADNLVALGSSSLRWTQVSAVNGTINTSDARLKENINPAGYGLEAVMQLRPVRFSWKDHGVDMGRIHLGLLAQEVAEVIPEAVVDHEWVENPDSAGKVWTDAKILGINYSEITPVLVAAIQEQQKLIEQLRAEIESLKKR